MSFGNSRHTHLPEHMATFFDKLKRSGLNADGVMSESVHTLAVPMRKRVRVPTKRKRLRGGKKVAIILMSRFIVIHFLLPFLAAIGMVLFRGPSCVGFGPSVPLASDYDAKYKGKK